MIRLAVHGAAGRMGARICRLACDDPRFQLVMQVDRTTNVDMLQPTAVSLDMVIDFSTDEGARDAVRLALEHDAALLVGTTALSRQTLAGIEVAIKSIPVLVAANTSVGVAVLSHVAASAAALLGPRYQARLVEVHHAGKRDAPSGTALRLADTLRRRAAVELPADRIHAIRAGDVIGEHSVEFAGAGERIRFTHTATDRDLFARGALEAAAWLQTRPPGRYSIEQAIGLETE